MTVHLAASEAAAVVLEKAGMQVLDRSWRCADGEIAIVAAERQVLVACEVRAGGGTRVAVSRAGRARLRRAAVQWMDAHGVRFDQVRVDVIALAAETAGGFTTGHIRGAG
ncbi:MAG: YraN family protein [Streptosporangiaceae bacterium]